MAKRFIFNGTAAALFDGATPFFMPIPLPVPDPLTGWITIPVTGPCGRIDADSLAAIIGQAGAKITSIGTTIGGAATDITVGLVQPRPGVAYAAGASMVQPLLRRTGNTGTIRRQQAYMAPGMVLYFLAENGGVPVVGPYQVAIEIEPLRTQAELIEAVQGQAFPLRQVLLTP